MKEKVLQFLTANSDRFVSGQEMCNEFSVSRTAVWKAIKQLRKDGYEIEAVTNRGYRLVSNVMPDILSQEQLEKCFETKWAGHPVIYKKQTGSTNDDIMALADDGYPHGTIVVTSGQTKGKGRRGRVWESPIDGNFYMSILLHPLLSPDKAPMITLIMALAMFRACSKLKYDKDRVKFGIKWPNDLVVSVDGGPYKKVCGILTEMRMEDADIKYVTSGIGVNCNMKEIPEELKASATTIKEAIGQTVNRAKLCADCWKYFEEDYEALEKAGDLSLVKEAYESGLVNKGRVVRVLDPKGEYDGTAAGITDSGELIVKKDDGTVVNVGNGEISVRGVMGYV